MWHAVSCSHLNHLDLIHWSYREHSLLSLLAVRAAQDNTMSNHIRAAPPSVAKQKPYRRV